MDRTTAKVMRDKLNAIFAEHGVDGYNFEVGNATYNDVEVTFKLVVREEGAKSREERDLATMARLSDLDPNKIGDGKYTLAGYKSRARKNPWIIEDMNTGTKYVINDATAKRWFAKDVA